MKTTKVLFLSFAALAAISLSLSAPLRLAQAQKSGDGGGGSPLVYPETKKVEVVEDYFGTKVADPYR
jgi:prolyl oligopeptidase